MIYKLIFIQVTNIIELNEGSKMKSIEAKKIVHRTKDSFWFATDYNMNIYRGCCHGCIYCDSRSVCYRNDHFDEVRVKKDALKIIRDDLSSKVKKGVVSMGAMSDPYNPFEKKMEMTRHALELIHAYGFGTAIATKSDLILRDMDILKDIQTHSPVIAKITITTPHDSISSIVEPNVCSSSARFDVVKELSRKGIFAGILLMPCLPFIEDNEEDILKMVELAHKANAKFIYPAFGMTLREGNREYYYEHLNKNYPGLKERYEVTYGTQYNCVSKKSKKLFSTFAKACDKFGIYYDMKTICRVYRYGYGVKQMQFDV